MGEQSSAGQEAPGLHSGGAYFGDVIRRRTLLKGAGALGVGLVVSGGLSGTAGASPAVPAGGGDHDKGPWWRYRDGDLGFDPVAPSSEDRIVVPDGYEFDVLLKWGDPLFPGAPDFDVNNQTRASQERQFGFNCDFVGYFP